MGLKDAAIGNPYVQVVVPEVLIARRVLEYEFIATLKRWQKIAAQADPQLLLAWSNRPLVHDNILPEAGGGVVVQHIGSITTEDQFVPDQLLTAYNRTA